MSVLLNKLIYYLLHFPWPVDLNDLVLPLINKNGWLGTDFWITHTARNNDRTKWEMKYGLNCFSHVSLSCLPLLNFHVLCVYSLKYTIGKDYWGNIGTQSLCCLSLLFFLLHSPSGIFLPGTELLQSPFRTEFSMGSRSWRYRRSMRRHRRFLRSYRRSLRSCRDPWGDRRPHGRRCGDADRCATR